ncbi:hypothetical protein GCM10022291_05540 [Postechiella marina]|uniref:SGNH/GDSL hydrolase family protein n=1 Tax=Postechiella marina TaxID=943941 RepID=A0ABP8C1Z0_9FLAO
MVKLLFKTGVYIILILICLELFVRVLHLGKDNPSRFVDALKVEKWKPNQTGFSVTGNRRQNFSEYHINNSGFNSYREYTPSYDRVEVALVGDSFIQGFHQDYYNSLGKKIENNMNNNVDVYEYGYAGYDFADQIHLVNAYKEDFDKIDHVILGLRYRDDLLRGDYKVVNDRMKLEAPLYQNLRKIKLLGYASNIGILDPVKKFPGKIISFFKNKKGSGAEKKKTNQVDNHARYLKNFKSLISRYGYDKSRFVLLISVSETPPFFMDYLKDNNFEYIDFGAVLNKSKTPTTLIYDQHWNNHGRTLIAQSISDYLIKKINTPH